MTIHDDEQGRPTSRPSRRGFLRTAAGVAGVTALAGAAGIKGAVEARHNMTYPKLHSDDAKCHVDALDLLLKPVFRLYLAGNSQEADALLETTIQIATVAYAVNPNILSQAAHKLRCLTASQCMEEWSAFRSATEGEERQSILIKTKAKIAGALEEAARGPAFFVVPPR